MITNRQNDPFFNKSAKISSWIAPRLNKFEAVLAILVVITLLGEILTDLPLSIFMVLVLNTLAILYFFCAYPTFNDENATGFKAFIKKLAYFGCCVGIMGILFRLQIWAGYDMMISIGCTTIAIDIIIVLISHLIKPELKLLDLRLILRMAVILFISLLLLITPTRELIKYRVLKEVRMEKGE